MSSTPQVVTVDSAGPVTTVAVTGDLDLATSPQLERAFSAALELSDSWVIDLREVGFIDSCGMRALLRARRDALRREGTLTVRPGTDAMMRPLVLANVASLFTWEQDGEAA